MKNQRGITLVSLVATVIITIILAAVSTYAGLQAYTDARVDAYIAKMKLVQTRVDIVAQQYNTWDKRGSESGGSLNDYIEELFEKAKGEYTDRNTRLANDGSKIIPSSVPSEYSEYKLPDITDKGSEGTNPNANNTASAKLLAVDVVLKDGKQPINYYFFTKETLDTVLGVSTIKEEDFCIAVDFVNGLIYDNKGVKSPTDNLTHYNHYFLATYDTRVGDTGESSVDAVAAEPVGTTQVAAENYNIAPVVLNKSDGTSIEISISRKDNNPIDSISWTRNNTKYPDNVNWDNVKNWTAIKADDEGKFVIEANTPGYYYAKETDYGKEGTYVGCVVAANKPILPTASGTVRGWFYVDVDESGNTNAVLNKKDASLAASKNVERIPLTHVSTTDQTINDGKVYDYSSNKKGFENGKYANAMDPRNGIWVWIPKFFINDAGNVEFTSDADVSKKSTVASSNESNEILQRAFGNSSGFWVQKMWDTSILNQGFQNPNKAGVTSKLNEFKGKNEFNNVKDRVNVLTVDQFNAILMLGGNTSQNSLPTGSNMLINFAIGASTQYSSNGNPSGVFCLQNLKGGRLLTSIGATTYKVVKGNLNSLANDSTGTNYYYRFVVKMDGDY